MHALHVIAVQTTGGQVSDAQVERLINATVGESWFDYLSVGGRWDGYFGKTVGVPGSGNVLDVGAHPNEAMQVLDAVTRMQNEAFCTARNNLTGPTVVAADMTGHVFGLPVEATEETAARMTASYLQSARAWNEMLNAVTLEDARAVPGAGMVGYYATRVSRLLDGVWCPDSHYFDTIAGSALPAYLKDGLRGHPHMVDEYGDLSTIALVAVDFHY